MAVQYQSETIKNLKKLRRHPPALIGLAVLVVLYTMCILAEFVAPYHYDNESRVHSFAPPTRIHLFDADGDFHLVPFIYNSEYSFDQYYRRIYVEQTDKRYQLRLFAKGDSYKLMGLIPWDRHLIGVEEGGRLFLMGADSRGRDIFSRIVYGSRVSLTVGFVGVLVSYSIGILVGGLAGFYGGWVDNTLMRICEMVMLVPAFYLLLALSAALPVEISSVYRYLFIVFILSFIGWARLARVIRGLVKSLRQREFVLAAQAIGKSDVGVIFSHIIPQTFSFLIVSVTLSIPAYILGESGLSLIGLGIQDPHASWGNMLSDAMNVADIKFHPWILLPGFFIFITVMAFNFLGDGLRDVFDPKAAR
ncbi:MAG: ABC transporter permease subunit [Chitinivibrionales bacterium]|nr:ABC transporter permease subunit [Chitinivibrionales bacterium]MBD3357791.1 ABC transporter permease subunit [Chitinivibrionales bacterium]